MSKHERVLAALRGEPVDQVPVGFWGHDYLHEWTPEGLVEATLERYRRFDWDFIKLNPRACFFVEDWGCRFEPSGNAREGPKLRGYVVKTSAHWEHLRPLDPQQGVLGEHLRALRLLGEALGGAAPFVQTIFSPLSIAQDLAGDDAPRIKRYMQEAPGALHAGLEIIAETYARYAQACLEAGASGIFFATTEWGTRDMLSDQEYEEFGRSYDLKVLAVVQEGASFNILHVCRGNNMLDLLHDYPVHALNWATTLPTNPTLEQGRAMSGKPVMGGISEKTVLQHGPPQAVAEEVRMALEETGGRGFLLAPGCSIPPQTPEAHLRAAVAAARAFSAS